MQPGNPFALIVRSGSHRAVIACGFLALGITLAPGIAGAASDNLKDVVVRNTAANAIPVTPQGTTRVSGTVELGNLPVEDGRLSTAPGVPAEPFHREANVPVRATMAIGPPVPAGESVAVSSVQAMASGDLGAGWGVVEWQRVSPNGDCDGGGERVATVANFMLGFSDTDPNFTHTFPVPQITSASDAGLCLVVRSATPTAIVVDGFTY
jgi:hypothetical protein